MSDEQTVNAANEAPIDDIELAYREAMAALAQAEVQVGNRRQVFRVLNAGAMQRDSLPNRPTLFLMQPSEYRAAK